MNKELVEVGEKYLCQAIGLNEEAVGKVTHKMENCVVIAIESCAVCDADTVEEKIKMVVAKYEHLVKV